MGKVCSDDSNFIFERIFIKFADNKDRHKTSDSIEYVTLSVINIKVTRPSGPHKIWKILSGL